MPVFYIACLLIFLGLGAKGFAEEPLRKEAIQLFDDKTVSVYLEDPQGADPLLKESVNDFRRVFEKLTGHALPSAPFAGGIAIDLRPPPALPSPSQAEAAAWGDGTISVTGEGIRIEALSSLGLVNSLYYLLDRWGCRWVMPGEVGEVIPKSDKLSLPIGSLQQKSSLDMRIKVSNNSPLGREWGRRNRNHFVRYLPTDHNWSGTGAGAIAPPALYFDPAKPETYRPEYYALIGGVRTPSQICTSHPDMPKLALDAANRFFQWAPTADSFPVEPNDNLDFCQCERCTAQDPPGTTFDGLPLLTDRVITFANLVADAIKESHPGKYVGFFAYNNHTLPPVKVRPRSNVLVGICRSVYDMYRLVPREKGDSASEFYELINRWKALEIPFFIYEYNPLHWNANFICPNYLEFAQTMKDTAAMGSLGTYPDGLIYYENSTNFLNFYFLFRFSVNTDLDPEQELAETCRAFYGPAGVPMLRYYQEMAKSTSLPQPPGVLIGGGFRHYDRLFTPELVQSARKAIEEAKALLSSSDIYARRVALADLNHRYLETYLSAVWNARAGDYQASVHAFDQLEAMVPELGKAELLSDANVAGPTDTLERVKGLRKMVLSEFFPDRLAMVTRWKMLGPFNNSDRGAEHERASFEPLASIDQPVRQSDGSTHSWKEVTSPTGGFLNFREVFGKGPEDWKAFYVYVGLEVSSNRKREAQMRMDSFNSFRVFLNGEEVFYRPGWDNDLPDKRVIPITLEEGANTIVVKCSHTYDSHAFPWGLYFRITDPMGHPIRGLDYRPAQTFTPPGKP